jgi:hypothetical protein
MHSMPRLHKETPTLSASLKDLETVRGCETAENGHKSHETQNQEWLCWRGPAAIYPTQLSKSVYKIYASSGSSLLAVRSLHLATTSDDRITNRRHYMCCSLVIYQVHKLVRPL